jgi:hypothetical protein
LLAVQEALGLFVLLVLLLDHSFDHLELVLARLLGRLFGWLLLRHIEDLEQIIDV